MRTRVFSPTYPTWALVRGTSRPAGETVSLHCTSSLRVHRNTPFLTRMETPVPVCRVQCLTSGSNYHRLMAASHRLTITANMDLVTAAYCVVCDNSDNIATYHCPESRRGVCGFPGLPAHSVVFPGDQSQFSPGDVVQVASSSLHSSSLSSLSSVRVRGGGLGDAGPRHQGVPRLRPVVRQPRPLP